VLECVPEADVSQESTHKGPMHPELERLIRLQQAESGLKRVEGELAEAPKSRATLEARLAEERSRLDAARAALDLCQKGRRQHEAALQDLETKRSKYKGQLMEVKTNKEYTAMLHEIETVERDIRAREDEVLAEMERAETLAQEIKSEESTFKAMEQEVKAGLETLDAKRGAIEAEAKRLAAERDQIAATVGGEALELFRRVAKLRGVAVAEARDGMCQLCHVFLRLQMYSDLKRNDAIVQCPACSRILYYEAPVPTVSPQP
jgi:predicted  nucleic acid-binding Zn-ribbon protein